MTLSSLDNLDRDIIDRLRRDPSISNKDIANATGASESTVGARIRALDEMGAMRLVAVRDIRALGYEYLAHCAMDVQGDIRKVARELAKIPEIAMVAMYPDSPEIIVQINARTRQDLARLLNQEFAAFPDIARIDTTVVLYIAKYNTQLGTNLSQPPEVIRGNCEDTDEDIIAALQVNARVSNREIARQLDLPESTVRNRIRRLVELKQIQITLITDVSVVGRPVSAWLKIAAQPKHARLVMEALSAHEAFDFVGLCSNKFNIVTVVAAKSQSDLADLVHRHVRSLPGVQQVEVRTNTEVLKFRYSEVRIK